MGAFLSPSELEARIPVWRALSGFWLDTSLQEVEFDYIARQLAASPFSLDELRKIHRYEVAPAVSANLFSIAGEWAGFDEAWLIERCSGYAAKRPQFAYRLRMTLQAPGFWFWTFREWRAVIRRVKALRLEGPQGGSRTDG